MNNRTEKLRQECVEVLNAAITEFERGGNGELDGDYITINYITAKRMVELLKKLEVPVYAKWRYDTDDENRPRWKCSHCGKICHKNPYDKKCCSVCGSRMRMES